MRTLLLFTLVLAVLAPGCKSSEDTDNPTPPASAGIEVLSLAPGDTLALPATLTARAHHPDQLHTVGVALLCGADTLAAYSQHVHSQEYQYSLYVPRPDTLAAPAPCRAVAWFIDHNGAQRTTEWAGYVR